MFAVDYQTLYARILQAVDTAAYLTPTEHVDPQQRPALDEIRALLHRRDFDADLTRGLIRKMHAEGRLDAVHVASALHVVAAHPKVRDWTEAARLAGEQEMAALDLGGPFLESNLASVDRHRGVLAFLRGHYGVALDHFTRAFERQRTPENVGNVLASLLRMGDMPEAESILAHVRRSFPPDLVDDLNRRIDADPDLAMLRPEEDP